MKEGYYNGIIAEYIAILYLFFKGYKLIRHRYSNKFGEIDLIFYHNKTIIFCEVKFRKGYLESKEALYNKQKMRIRNSASIFMRNFEGLDARFDVVVLSFWNIEHIKNAF